MILLDEVAPLTKLMPFIRCLNDYLIHRPAAKITRATTVYRASRMNASQGANIKEGASLLPAAYSSIFDCAGVSGVKCTADGCRATI